MGGIPELPEPPPPLELPPMGMGIPLLPEEPEDPPDMPPGIPGRFTGMFKLVPLGTLIVPRGGRLDSSRTETLPPIGIPLVVIMGPLRPLR